VKPMKRCDMTVLYSTASWIGVMKYEQTLHAHRGVNEALFRRAITIVRCCVHEEAGIKSPRQGRGTRRSAAMSERRPCRGAVTGSHRGVDGFGQGASRG
jgi:hypothetical protein